MPSTIRFTAPVAVQFELRQRALREGRSLADATLRVVEKGLAASPPIDIESGTIDKVERGSVGKATACYLSPALAKSIQRLAAEQRRSASWVVRDLLRCELRNRGLLPTPPDQHRVVRPRRRRIAPSHPTTTSERRQQMARLTCTKYTKPPTHCVTTWKAAPMTSTVGISQAATVADNETKQPWEQIGVSRATWYRHGKPDPAVVGPKNSSRHPKRSVGQIRHEM